MTDSAIATPPAQTAPSGPDQYELGVKYMLGRGVSADLGMAAASFLNAADLNNPQGLYASGMMYLKGVGVSASPEMATDYLQKSATLGYAPAKKVLDALSQGKDISKFQIVIPASESHNDSAPALQPAASNPVTPARIIAIAAGVLVLVAGAGGGFWAWSSHSQEQAALAASQAKALESQRAAVEAERKRVVSDAQAQARLATDKATGALKEVEVEKRRLAEQQAEVAAKAEALRQREVVQAAKAADAAVAASNASAGATSVATPAPAPAAMSTAANGVWDARMKDASPHLRKMMEAALANTGDIALIESAAIRAMPRPARGDRKLARPQNEEGLAASARLDLPRAVASFTAASIADESDEEIATNLGYALVKAGRGPDAQAALMRALYLNPSRSSAWYNLGLAFLAQNQEQAAYASFLLTYQFAGSQQKSREWFEKVSLDESNPPLRRMSQKLLTSPIVKASPQSP